MSWVVYLLLCLSLGVVLISVGTRPRLWTVSEKLNRAALSSAQTAVEEHSNARIGGRGQILVFRGRRSFRLIFRLRALATALIAIILLVLRADTAAAGPDVVVPAYAGFAFHAACGFALYYLAFTWSYRLTLRDSVLWVPTATCGWRSYDLNNLEFFEDSGPYTISLYFRDGSYTDIMKAVRDRGYLMTVLGLYGDRVTPA